jgi:hypothetical protein
MHLVTASQIVVFPSLGFFWDAKEESLYCRIQKHYLQERGFPQTLRATVMVHWAIGISTSDKVLGDDEKSLTKLRHGRPFHVKKSQAPTFDGFSLGRNEL